MTIPRPRKDRPFVVVLGKKFFVDGRLGSNELTLEQLAKTSRGLSHLNEIAATSDEHWKVVSAVTTDFSPVARLVVRHKLNLNDAITDPRGGTPVHLSGASAQRMAMMEGVLSGRVKVTGVRDVTPLIISGHFGRIIHLGAPSKDRLTKAAKHFDKKARKAGKELRFNI